MTRKVVVPRPISAKIGRFGLSRSVFVKLLTRIHGGEIAEVYEKHKTCDLRTMIVFTCNR